MVCERLGNIIPAIKSRCLLVRIPSPSTDEIKKCIRIVSK